MNKVELVRPARREQCAALMLTVFTANPGVVLTRREVESLVDVSQFSESTRQRALWTLSGKGCPLDYDSGWWEGRPTTYWMPADALANAG
jgi:hypothetical protein